MLYLCLAELTPEPQAHQALGVPGSLQVDMYLQRFAEVPNVDPFQKAMVPPES